MSTRLILAGVDPEATQRDWSCTDHSSDQYAVNSQTWMSVDPGDYGQVYLSKQGLVFWQVYDRYGYFVTSGSSSTVLIARQTVEAVLAERSS